MTVTEVLQVIEACQKCRVKHFELDGLKLDFDDTPTIKHVVADDPVAAAENLERNSIVIKMEQLEEMKLRDPYVYEQIVAMES